MTNKDDEAVAELTYPTFATAKIRLLYVNSLMGIPLRFSSSNMLTTPSTLPLMAHARVK